MFAELQCKYKMRKQLNVVVACCWVSI